MIIDFPNPSQVILQVVVQGIDGSPRTSLLTASVRVYHVDGGSEVEDLHDTSLSQVGVTNTWRYVWSPVALPANQYFAEYSLEDADGYSFVGTESLAILSLADAASLAIVQNNTEIIRKIETNRKRIFNNQLIIYEDDGTTVWLRWNLFDVNNVPTNGVNVFDSVPE